MGVTVMFGCSGVNKERFLEYVMANPATCADWGDNWEIETTGKEDDMFTTYLVEPFNQARRDGVIPEHITSIGGSWGMPTDAGEVKGMNMIYTFGYDCTDVWDLTVPQKAENLLVAGHCVAGDKISHAATRSMMCCAVTGQGAGVAAAVFVKDGVRCGAVDIKSVQKALERQGVRVFLNGWNLIDNLSSL